LIELSGLEKVKHNRIGESYDNWLLTVARRDLLVQPKMIGIYPQHSRVSEVMLLKPLGMLGHLTDKQQLLVTNQHGIKFQKIQAFKNRTVCIGISIADTVLKYTHFSNERYETYRNCDKPQLEYNKYAK
jgi:hypothetical protein